jgi:hypothetical protein
MSRGNCVRIDAETADLVFFTDSHLPRHLRDWAQRERRHLCGTCPVRTLCASYAETNWLSGSWGGGHVKVRKIRNDEPATTPELPGTSVSESDQ